MRNRVTNTFKYQIIEYDYVTMTDTKIEVCKTLHKTNSRIVFWIIIIALKIQHIKYEIV